MATDNSDMKKWEYDLQEYSMTKDVPNDYIASVRVRGSLSIDQVIRLICEERTDLRFETMKTSNDLIAEKTISLLQQGYAVKDELVNYLPGITGLFDESHLFDPTRNQCVVNSNVSKRLREAVGKVTAVYSGHTIDLGGAKIEFIYDVASKQRDGKITPGGLVEVTGNKIRCIDETGEGLGRIVFLDSQSLEEVATVSETTVGINEPSRLMFIVPSTLTDGEYMLRIETYFSRSDALLKNLRVIDYRLPLYVGDRAEEGGDDDEPDGPVVQ